MDHPKNERKELMTFFFMTKIKLKQQFHSATTVIGKMDDSKILAEPPG